MTTTISPSKRFHLPAAGIFQPNGTDDPLPYYYKPVVGSIYRERIEQGLALLKPPYTRILEIGFGSGIVLPSLCTMGESVYGVDLNSHVDIVEESLRQARCNCTLIQADISAAEFEHESFDLIVAFSILEHIRTLPPLINQLQSCLKPGGHLLVGMPRVDRLMERAFQLIGFANINEHHVSDYKQCLAACEKDFSLIKLASLPATLPESFGLYYNMLFEKN